MCVLELTASGEESCSVAVNGGDLLVADTSNNCVRRIDSTGRISTVVGTGAEGFSGDNGLATAAALHRPVGLAVDPAGNLYIADSGNNRVRKVSAGDNTITTISGTDSEGFGGDGGPANLASLYGPFGMQFTQSGDLLFADMFHMRIRRISGSTARLTYPTIRRGKVSSPQLQTLANYGSAVLQLTTPVFQYSALDPATTTCSTTTAVAPLATCVLGVEFAPTVIGNDVVGSVMLPSLETNVTPSVTADGQVLDVNPTSIALVSSANPSVLGNQIRFTATVTSDDHGRTGSVTFSADGSPICSGPLAGDGTASCTTASLTLGSHNIVAQYAGDAQNAAATSPTLTQVVKQQTSLALTSSANPSTVTNSVTLTATASAANGMPTGTVSFYDGSTLLGGGPLTTAQASWTVATLSVGAHAITVQYSGDASNAATTSSALTQTVQQATTTTMLGTSNASVVVGSSITLTATVLSSGGPTPTGSVQFTEGTAVYGSAQVQSDG
ncbi:MAG: Ig-like domain repeat protein, partial [Terriglobus roseus]|nr:Ig-like domain repeat protein [Terriglobus roseus]